MLIPFLMCGLDPAADILCPGQLWVEMGLVIGAYAVEPHGVWAQLFSVPLAYVAVKTFLMFPTSKKCFLRKPSDQV